MKYKSVSTVKWSNFFRDTHQFIIFRFCTLDQDLQILSTFNPYKPHPFCGTLANSVNPDQTLQNGVCFAASDQVLHCLLTEVSIKISIKKENTTEQPYNWK